MYIGNNYILSVNNRLVNNVTSKKEAFEYSEKTEQNQTVPFSVGYSYIPFRGGSPKYLEAKKYLDRAREVFEFLPPKNTDLYDLSLNRLDGIQEGIKVFDGLNMKEIAFVARTITEIGVNRGCHNMCSHCYADAKPPIKETAEQINKMSWNDFKSLTDGFEELNSRLGFYASGPGLTSKRTYIAPFHDADGIEVALKDNEGVEHDFIDIAKSLYSAIGVPVVFDTAGWTLSNKKLQTRAEKFAQYYSKPENIDKLYQFNISLNPFHALYTRQVFLERGGDFQKADKFKELYEDRVANAIFTFTPILGSEKVGFIQRVATANDSVFDGFREVDLQNMKKNITKRTRLLYEKDLAGEQKFVKTPSDIESNMYTVDKLMSANVGHGITLAERGQKFFGENNRHAEETSSRVYSHSNMMKSLKKAKDILSGRFCGIVDANGDYYITTWSATFPTEIKLNFENNGKITAPIKPFLQKDIPIKRTTINTTD